jgi:putative transposase
MRKEIARDLRTIFDAANLHEAERLVKLTAKKYAETAPKLSEWIESDVSEGLARNRGTGVITQANRKFCLDG